MKVLITGLAGSLVGLGVLAQIPVDQGTVQELAHTSAQGVLSVVCVTSMSALAFVLKKLLAAKESQLKEQKEIFMGIASKDQQLLQGNMDAFNALAKGFHRFADVIQECPGGGELNTAELSLPDSIDKPQGG